MFFDIGGWNGAELRFVVVIFFALSIIPKHTILFLLRHDHMSLGLFSDINIPYFGVFGHVNVTDFVFLTLLDVLESKHSFLTHQCNLIIGPYLHRILALVLDFVLKLDDSVFEIVFVVLTLLCLLQKELSFLIKSTLHLFLYLYLTFDRIIEIFTETLEVTNEHLM